MTFSRTPSLGALLLLALAVIALLLTDDDEGDGSAPARGAGFARVLEVVDGDTVVVLIGGEEERVRYIGVDTPETVDPDEPVGCFGHRASRANERLVEGERVRLVFDAEERDRYGRLLAYVYLDDLFVNAELLKRGLARTLEIAPNTRFAALFDRLEQEAANAGVGLWNAC